MNKDQLRSKYKEEIQLIKEEVEGKNLFISLGGIDEIIQLFEKLNLKERNEIQNTLLETILDYTTRLCKTNNVRLINENFITQAILDSNKLAKELIKMIQSNNEREIQEIEPVQEGEKVSNPEKLINTNQLRAKYKKEIEKIREKVHGKNLFINLSGVDELITSLETMNLNENLQAAYLEKLLDSMISFCKNQNERLINETYIKQAILEVNRTEVDLLKKVLTIEKDDVIELEKQPVEPEILKEIEEITIPEEYVEEFEDIEKNEVLSTFEEVPTEEKIIPEEIITSIPEKEPENLIPPKPKIINCPFCGSVNEEVATFCPQCGMILKK
ncbi:MAG: zinc ribbon domain-containing protein [Candidatus Odinarchaeota archaeon]